MQPLTLVDGASLLLSRTLMRWVDIGIVPSSQLNYVCTQAEQEHP